MIAERQCFPVSPNLAVPKTAEAEEATGDLEDAARESDIVLGDPIVGKIQPDPAYTHVRVLTSPKDMTPEEFARHCVTRLPLEPHSCEYCAAARKPNVHHKRSNRVRKVPLLVADYGFLTVKASDEVVPFFVAHLQPWKLTFASVVDTKGVDPCVVKRLAQWILDCGLTHVCYRSDREPAIRKMLQAAIRLAGVHGHLASDEEVGQEDDVVVAVPEESHVGESQSNGIAERAVQAVEGQVLTMKLNLEARLQMSIPCHHPLMAWLVEYAGMRLSKYQPGEDGKTP